MGDHNHLPMGRGGTYGRNIHRSEGNNVSRMGHSGNDNRVVSPGQKLIVSS